MKLSRAEFNAMNTGWRRWMQARIEYPLFRRLGLDAAGRDVLELGCGNGYGAELLHRQTLRAYTGVDLMEEQIAIARRLYPRYEFVVGDATDLRAFPDASRDLVVIFGVLHHIPDWRRVLDECARVLRPGGGFFIEEPRAVDMRVFDFFFRWGHPKSDISLPRIEGHCRALGMRLVRRQWSPILTLYHWRKDGPPRP